MVRHLKANKVDIAAGKALTMGAELKFDVQSEEVTNNDKAKSLLKRTGRKGFEVPELALAAK